MQNGKTMGEVKVYKMNDYEWWASKLSPEETEAFYNRETGEVNDFDEIRECDIDSEGLWWTFEPGTKEHEEALIKLNGLDRWQQGVNRTSGDLINKGGDIQEWISFREAIERSGEYTEPYCIASTEY